LERGLVKQFAFGKSWPFHRHADYLARSIFAMKQIDEAKGSLTQTFHRGVFTDKTTT
jgi:hypothetical protein